MIALKINDKLSNYSTKLLSTYLKFPDGQPITAIDFNARDGEFLYKLTSKHNGEKYLYGASSDGWGCKQATEKYGFYKISHSDYKSEMKITNNAFSLAVVDPFIDRRIIEEMFNKIDPFTMPNFEEEVRKMVLRREKEKEQLLKEMEHQIDLSVTNDDLTINKEVEQQKKQQAEIIQQKIEEELNKRIRAWRETLKQQERNISNLRFDSFLLQRATTYLKPGGILVMITPKELIDSTISHRLVNQYTDIKILRLDDDEYKNQRKCIILAKKRQKPTREKYALGVAISRAKEKRIATFGQVREITATDEEERIKQEFLANVDRMYDVLSPQVKPSYEVPVGFNEEIHEFRIGAITAEEALFALQKSSLIQSYQELHTQSLINEDLVTPTPLHKGHIMLLLTSGFLNGYIGEGPNKHLVKGNVTKEIREFEEVEEDGTKKIVEREFYNIGVKYLDRYGQFHKIM